MVHRNARLTPAGRRILVERIEVEGWPVAVAAESMGVSRETAYRWLRRWRSEGAAGLEDRASRPRRSPNRTPLEVEDRICTLRTQHRWGPHRIAFALGMPRSTVERVLRRCGLSRLDAIDPPTRRVVRRYERDNPGELVHIDVKKLGRIPNGGGWRAHGRGDPLTRRALGKLGYDFLHVAVDDHSRVVYVESLNDEKGDTCAGFLARAVAWFADHDVTVERVMTDNARNYRTSRVFNKPSPTPGSGICSPGRTGPKQTAKQNASTRPSSTNGHTISSTRQTSSASIRSPPGSTTTTGTDSTPKSAQHPQVGYPSTTSV